MDEQTSNYNPAETKRIIDSLNVLISSETFAGANRLQDFLTYIVEESLAGRGNLIRAKRIAADVYSRTGELNQEQETQVRVDAGRLRRRLSLYYGTEGANNSIQIVIKSGGYVPVFKEQSNDEPDLSPETQLELTVGQKSKSLMAFVILIIIIGAATAYYVYYVARTHGDQTPQISLDISESRREAERLAVLQKSPSALQAYSLVEEARSLIYPPLDAVRLNAAAEICKRAINLNPSSYRGYSCVARAFGFLAFFSNAGPKRKELVTTALKMADKGTSIDPTNPHAQSARAWVLFVNGEFDSAMDLARRSLAMAPTDYLVRNFYGTIAVFNGNSREVLKKEALQGISESLEQLYHPFLLAGAKLHAGEYQDAIDHIHYAAKKTGKISPFMTAILAAAHQGIGDDAKAAELIKELQQFWPGASVESQLLKFYRHRENVEQIVDRIYEVDPSLKPSN